MGAGSGKLQFVTVNPIKQQPIWFDMKAAPALPIAFQGGIFVAGRKCRLFDQQGRGGRELSHVLAALFCFANVAFEAAGPNRDQRRNSRSLNI